MKFVFNSFIDLTLLSFVDMPFHAKTRTDIFQKSAREVLVQVRTVVLYTQLSLTVQPQNFFQHKLIIYVSYLIIFYQYEFDSRLNISTLCKWKYSAPMTSSILYFKREYLFLSGTMQID